MGAPGVLGCQQWEGPKDRTHLQGSQEAGKKKETEFPPSPLSPLPPLPPLSALPLSPALPNSCSQIGFYAPSRLII